MTTETATTAAPTIGTRDVALFPVVGGWGDTLDVVAVAYVRISPEGTITAGIEGDARPEDTELTFEPGELNPAIRYASSLAGHDLDVRPFGTTGHGY